jgi:CubicO group peptidase (beta-lactamase class C family)
MSLALSAGVFAQNKNNAEFDKILSSQFKADAPGCAALVMKKGEVVYRKAFGKANLELNVPMQPGMIFRIGSITKQFTAVAILQLEEQGKLSLQDEITKFIPDYPTHGYKITVEHLLTHTSGIKSYTGMKEATTDIMRKDMTPKELIDFFKDQPMDFEPGTKYLYSNSGYALLGYIIEKVSGESYAQYLENHIFKPLGLKNTSYDNTLNIVKNRVPGYSKTDSTYNNAVYISMTLPFAAGSLLSTVDDLYTWTKGVRSGRIIKPETFAKALVTYKLKDGSSTGYGYGLETGEIFGSQAIWHNGGINGFLTMGIYLPGEDIFVAVFSNCDGNSPDNAAFKIAALAAGKMPVMKEMAVDTLTLKKYTGVYENTSKEQRVITFKGGKLYSQRTGGQQFLLTPYASNKFFYNEGMSFYEFVSDKTGKVTTVNYQALGQASSIWPKTDKQVPVHFEITLKPEEMQKFTGEYQLAPGFSITVTLENGHLMGQATGQGKFEMFSESANIFFLKIVDAKVEFIADPDGSITKMILHQNGDHEGKKIVKSEK